MKKIILLCFIVIFSCNSKQDNDEKTISVDNSNLFISEIENENTLSTYITESPILNKKIPTNNIKIIGDSDNYYSLAINKSKRNNKIIIISFFNKLEISGNLKGKIKIIEYKDYKSNVFYQDSIINNPEYIFVNGNAEKY